MIILILNGYIFFFVLLCISKLVTFKILLFILFTYLYIIGHCFLHLHHL